MYGGYLQLRFSVQIIRILFTYVYLTRIMIKAFWILNLDSIILMIKLCCELYANKALTATCIFAELLCDVFWAGGLRFPNLD